MPFYNIWSSHRPPATKARAGQQTAKGGDRGTGKAEQGRVGQGFGVVLAQDWPYFFVQVVLHVTIIEPVCKVGGLNKNV